MHFHLPKPLHGWREFVGEVGIIVIGVLIALGAEQLIEQQHWRHKSEQTIDAVRDEMESVYLNAAEAATVAPCVDRQLVMLEEALARADFSGAPVYSDQFFNKYVVRAPSRPWADNVWSAATSEGVVSHLPPKLAASFQSFYAQNAIMELNARQIDVLGWRLRSLAFPQGPDARSRAIEAIEEQRGHTDYMALVANQLMGRADSIGMKPAAGLVTDSVNKSGTVKFCRDHGLPLGRPAPEPPT